MADYESLQKLAEAVVTDLAGAGKAVSTAESCTGGWIAKSITDIPGSSAVFAYGVVSYSNGAKESILGVQNQTLEEHGAVSEPVVEEMAKGALNLSGADMAVAVSGVAGPDGGTEENLSVRSGLPGLSGTEQRHTSTRAVNYFPATAISYES